MHHIEAPFDGLLENPPHIPVVVLVPEPRWVGRARLARYLGPVDQEADRLWGLNKHIGQAGRATG